MDKHLLETRDRIMPFIFVFNSGINTNYRSYKLNFKGIAVWTYLLIMCSDFLNYLNGTHVALCEEFSEHGKFWVCMYELGTIICL